ISGASAETRAAIADLILLREQFIKNRVIFVESSRMIAILKVLGATDEDMEKMRTVSNNLLDDPTLPFRKSKNGRFCFDFKFAALSFGPLRCLLKKTLCDTTPVKSESFKNSTRICRVTRRCMP
ncbi:hypothetical protein N7494_003998, partial [Penicillium frequentans]